jgi:hypothetical protein
MEVLLTQLNATILLLLAHVHSNLDLAEYTKQVEESDN